MSDSTMRVRIDGEPYRPRAAAYREKHYAHALAWSEFAKSYGATGYLRHGRGMSFGNGKVPSGWTKPKSPSWNSHPKKGHPDEAKLAAFRAQHPAPSTRDIFGDDLCFDLSWEGAGGSHGSGMIGFFIDGPIIGWAGDIYTAIIPDPEAAIRSHLENWPSTTVLEPAASWRLPDGLARITEAEDRLIYAQAEVAVEREKAARQEAA